jgi:hypothetical protein
MLTENIRHQLLFFIVIHRFSLVKAAINALQLRKLCKECLTSICHGTMLSKNASISQFSNCQRRNKDHCAHLNWLPNWQLKNKEALLFFTGLPEDGGREKFAEKSLRISI